MGLHDLTTKSLPRSEARDMLVCGMVINAVVAEPCAGIGVRWRARKNRQHRDWLTRGTTLKSTITIGDQHGNVVVPEQGAWVKDRSTKRKTLPRRESNPGYARDRRVS